MISHRMSFAEDLCQVEILELIVTVLLEDLWSETNDRRSWKVPFGRKLAVSQTFSYTYLPMHSMTHANKYKY